MTSAADYRALREAAARLRDDGIQRGNDGIDIGTWTPPGEPERPTLPGHEHEINQRHDWQEVA